LHSEFVNLSVKQGAIGKIHGETDLQRLEKKSPSYVNARTTGAN